MARNFVEVQSPSRKWKNVKKISFRCHPAFPPPPVFTYPLFFKREKLALKGGANVRGEVLKKCAGISASSRPLTSFSSACWNFCRIFLALLLLVLLLLLLPPLNIRHSTHSISFPLFFSKKNRTSQPDEENPSEVQVEMWWDGLLNFGSILTSRCYLRIHSQTSVWWRTSTWQTFPRKLPRLHRT